MDPSGFLHHQYQQGGYSSVGSNNRHIPQGSKLATYMNQQNFPQQPTSVYNVQDMNRGLNLDSNTIKKLSLTGIQEFVPQPPFGGMDLNTTNQFTGGNPNPRGLRLPNATTTSSFSADRISNTLNTPPPPILGNSPRQSPTPASMGMVASSHASQDSSAGIAIYNERGTTYFYSGDERNMGDSMGTNGSNGRPGSVMIPNYSVFPGSPSQLAASKTRANTPASLAKSVIKMELLKKQYICMSQMDPESSSELLPDLENFQNLVPLEPPPPSPLHKSHTFGYTTSVYKATNTNYGSYVCLRRIHSFRLVNTKCMVLVDQWKKLQHSNLVSLKQVFTTKAFGDHSMIFVCDFYPGSETLMNKHFNNSSHMANAFVDPFSGASENARPFSQQKNQILRQQAIMTQNGLLPESLLWNYIIQLTAGLRYIHSASLACRTLDPTKIIISGGPSQRLLLNCCGIFDVLTFDPTSSNPMAAMAHYQQEDLIALGKIVLALACNSFLAIQRENLQTSMEIVTSTYSSDLRNFIMYLLTNPTRIKSVNDLMPMIGARFYNQLDATYMLTDSIETELTKEIESSRLFRILTKICIVVDRAELNGDYSWSEYGDCYMLKLFRDYVFHQTMDDGRPWLDMAHVISNLNKLDAGVADRICLMSRDEQNVLVVSYSELKRCLDQAFSECVQATRSNATA